MPTLEDRIRLIKVNGHERAYLKVGSGPALLLLHGLGGNLLTWERVIPALAERFTVIAPDLLGHGRSAKPRADYSLGGYANGMRDLLTILDVDQVSVVGHSFGGGVAMQFAYQFPERSERVVLVGSGGLGPEVSPLLRALTLPGSGFVLELMSKAPVRQIAAVAGRIALAIPGIGDGRLTPSLKDLPEVLEGFDALSDDAGRSAFLHVLRAAVDPAGQVVTMLDRTYLAQAMPVLIIWGENDTIIPVAHGYRGAEMIPGSRLVTFDSAGHFPHRDRPGEFVEAIIEFISATKPSTYNRARFRKLLRSGGPGALTSVTAEDGEGVAETA